MTIFGIDLGTTHTCVSVYNGSPTLLKIDNKELLKSIVSINKNTHQIDVGKELPSDTHVNISNIKRIIGQTHEELTLKKIQFPSYLDKDLNVCVNGKTFTPEEVTSMILKKVKSEIEKIMPIKKVIITVPAYFHHRQRKATIRAAEMAGLQVVRIINEPTAAALAYNLQQKEDSQILVFDFGGGTLDISVLEVEDEAIEVISTSGNTFLGGIDIDQILEQYLFSEYERKNKESLFDTKKIREECKQKAVHMKHGLSLHREFGVEINNCRLSLKQWKFKYLCTSLLKSIQVPIQKALTDADYKPDDIDTVVLVGGSTRNYFIIPFLKRLFPKSTICNSIDPDKTVSVGACVQGYILENKDSNHLLLDVTPFSLGIAGINNKMIRLINRNSTIPVSVTKTFTTTVDNQDTIDVNVFEGERYLTTDCKHLCSFQLSGLPKHAKNHLQIDITFKLDISGLFYIQAVERTTKKQHSVTIEYK